MKYLLIIFLFTLQLNAQNYFEHLNTHDGLSQNTILSVAQDSFGYIWLGSKENGLDKFDGKTFIHYKFKEGQPNSLSSPYVNKLLSGEDGTMWIGTNRGLDFYNPIDHSISRAMYKNLKGILHSFSGQVIRSLKKETNGDVWVVSSDKLFFKANKATVFTELKLPLETSVVDIEPLHNQTYLITSGKYVYIFDKEKGSITRNHMLDYAKISYINRIFKDSDENLFFGAYGGGFAVYLKREGKTVYYNTKNTPLLKSGIIRTFCEGNNNEVYIATFNGLYELDTYNLELKGHFSENTEDTSLSHNSIQAVYKDFAGNIWIGTYSGGVNIKYPTNYSFKTFRHSKNDSNSISSNVVNVFYEDAYGVWIGTDGKGINLFSNGTFKNYDSDANIAYVKAIHKKDKDRIWLGGYKSGLTLFNQRTKRTEKKSFENYSVYEIQKDNIGMLWLALNDKGLAIVDQDHMEEIDATIPIPEELNVGVKNLLFDPKLNVMIVCSMSRIYFYNFSLKKFIEIKQSPYTDAIHEICDLFLDSSNNLWVGTSDGVLKITNINATNGNCNIEKHNLYNVLNNNYIKSINEDNSQRLWISTLNGICRVTKDFDNITTYNRYYNIQGNEFVNKASLRSKDKLIWFGGNEGFTVFNPEKLEKSNYIPPLVFSNLTINNKEYSANENPNYHQENIVFTKSLDLDYWEKNIVLTVSALNYIAAKRNKYKWTFSEDGRVLIEGTTDVISLNNLKSGSYNLTVNASNNDGLWTQEPLELAIHVSTPLWRTKLAYFIYIILLAVLLLIFNRLYLNRKRFYDELKLEKLNKLREKESHEEKLTFFTNISHEIRTPLTLISGPIDQALSLSKNVVVEKTLLVAKKHADYLKDLTDELLDFRKVEKRVTDTKKTKVDIKAFISEMCQLFEDSIKTKSKTKIIFESTFDESIDINEGLIKKIIINILFNAHKHNVGTNDIHVYLRKEYLPTDPNLTNKIIVNDTVQHAHKIVLIIEDKGKGIKKKNLPKLFNRFFQENINADYLGSGIGLAFIKMLVLKIQGQIKVETKKGVGTRFSVLLPVKEFSEKVIESSREVEKTLNSDFQKTEDQIKKRATILLVEDNSDLLDWMVSFLSEKFNCLRAENGKEGLKLAKKKNPDIIVSDVMMPKMDGYEMCRALKNDVSTSHIPLILLSAKAIDKSIEEGFLSGANSYIKKPFNPDALVKSVENFLALKDNIVKKYNTDFDDLSEIEKLSVYDRNILDKINSYIEDHMSDVDMNIENMSSELAMSRSTLYRKIKSLTKSSPNDYLRNYRLFIAVKLIKKRELSIKEVSEKVGFNDFYYFKRCFFKKFGLKPENI